MERALRTLLDCLRRSVAFVVLLGLVWVSYSLEPQQQQQGIGRRQVLVDATIKTAITTGLWTTTQGAAAVWATDASAVSQQQQEEFVVLPRSTNNICLPRVGYSLYKTPAEQVAEGVSLALQAGVRHFDCASQYDTNRNVGLVLKRFLHKGEVETRDGLTKFNFNNANSAVERERLVYLTHKVSNVEQSLSSKDLQRNLSQQSKLLGKSQIDLVMIHSPLTDRNRRLSTYATLCDLMDRQKIGSVGVCNFGVVPLQEIVDANLPAPSVIQLALSPFNQHKDVCEWAKLHESLLSCSAWSKLSSVNGPVQGWDILATIAKTRGENSMTKQQVLIRWAVQHGYLCVPRSNSKYKVERRAIQENSWDSTKMFVLSEKEMSILDGLDEQITAGQLFISDGWEESDILSSSWDPTTAIV